MKVMKLLIMQSSPASHHFLRLRSNFLFSNHPQSLQIIIIIIIIIIVVVVVVVVVIVIVVIIIIVVVVVVI
jgi:hypothetical protein